MPCAAVFALANIDPENQGLVPVLVKVCEQGGTADPALLTSLAKIGKPAVGPLLKLVKSGSNTSRKNAIQVLAQIENPGKEAVPELLRIIKSKDEVPLWHAASIALGKVGPDAAEAIPTLVKNLEGPYGCFGEAEALGRIGKADDKVVLALVAAFKDKDNRTRRSAAAWALGEINAIEVWRVLVEALQADKAPAGVPRGRRRETMLASPSTPMSLESPDHDDRAHLIFALGKLGRTVKPAASALTRWAISSNAQVFDALCCRRGPRPSRPRRRQRTPGRCDRLA